MSAVWDLRRRTYCLHSSREFCALHEGHHDVGEQEINRLFARDPIRLMGVTGPEDQVVESIERRFGDGEDVPIIINEELSAPSAVVSDLVEARGMVPRNMTARASASARHATPETRSRCPSGLMNSICNGVPTGKSS